jgi:hypothetical protein
MKVFSIGLGNKRGEFELRVTATSEKTGKYQAVANGLVYFESDDTTMEDYETTREIVMEGVRINTPNKEALS